MNGYTNWRPIGLTRSTASMIIGHRSESIKIRRPGWPPGYLTSKETGDDTMRKRDAKNETAPLSLHPDRREFGKLALTGTIGTTAFLGSAARSSKAMEQYQPGIGSCAHNLPPNRPTSSCSFSNRSAPNMSALRRRQICVPRKASCRSRTLRGRGHHGMEHRQHRCP